MKSYIGHSLPKIQNQDAALLAVRRSEGLFCRDIYPKDILQGPPSHGPSPPPPPPNKTLALRENFLGEMFNFTEERRGGEVLEEGYNPPSILLSNYPCKGIRCHKQSGENKQCSLRSRTGKTNKKKHVPTTFLVCAEILSFVRPTEC